MQVHLPYMNALILAARCRLTRIAPWESTPRAGRLHCLAATIVVVLSGNLLLLARSFSSFRQQEFAIHFC